MQTLTRIKQSPTAPDFIADPYQFYDRIRALGDFVFWEDYDMPMATSHEAVKTVLNHPAFGREVPRSQHASRPDHLATFNRIDDHSPMRIEPPEHTRMRDIVKGALKDDTILSMAPTISRICDELIDQFPAGSAFDAQGSFADQLTGITVMRFLGLPDDMHAQIQTWARQMSALQYARRDRAVEDAAEKAAVGFFEFMDTYGIENLRKRSGSDNFINYILSTQNTVTTEEVVSLVALFVQAGAQGLAFCIGNSLLQLADTHERALALSPNQITATVDECIRFDPALHVIERHAQEDVTLLGKHFKRNTKIGCLLGSACHDDAIWPDGNTFDPFRAYRPNMAFGSGIHACIGGTLTTMTMKIALPAFFSRCPKMRVVEKPTYANDYWFRRLERLMIEV